MTRNGQAPAGQTHGCNRDGSSARAGHCIHAEREDFAASLGASGAKRRSERDTPDC